MKKFSLKIFKFSTEEGPFLIFIVMLNRLDFRLNKILFTFYSYLGFIPFKFHQKTAHISYQSSKFRVIACKSIFAFICCVALFKNCRLAQTLVNFKDVNLAHLPIQVVHVVGGNVIAYYLSVLLQHWPVIVALFNDSLETTNGKVFIQ